MNNLKKWYLIVAVLTLAALWLAACGAQPAPAVPTAGTGQPAAPSAQPDQTPSVQPQTSPAAVSQLGGTVWQWTKTVYNDGKTIDVANPANYTIEFLPANNQVSIKADCNMVQGSYTEDGNNLTITLGAATLAMCPPGSQDAEYLKELGEVAQYLIQGETLTLNFKQDSGGMTFVPAAAQPAQPTQPTQPAQPAGGIPGMDLGGKTWQWVTTVSNNGQTISPTNSADYTIQFAMADGKVAIKADCNNAEGEFMTDGQNIQIMIGGVTRAMCPPGSLSDEFLKELSEATAYKVEGDTLTLTLAGGTMTFTAGQTTTQPAGQATTQPPAQATTQPPAPGGAPASLEGPTWKWINTTTADGSSTASPNPDKFTLKFDPATKRFLFVADCNNGSGSYTLSGQQLTTHVEGMTRAICPPPSDDYIRQLGDVASYAIEGSTLRLALRQAGTMTFTTSGTAPAPGAGGGAAATPSAPGGTPGGAPAGSNLQRLTSGVWKWQQSADSSGQTWNPPVPANYTIQFNPNGTVSAKVDCNTSSGVYQADESNLTISLGPTTMMACPPPTVDTLYLKQLGDVSSYFFDGNDLILLWKMDSGSMKFSQ